jgi:hypothetical protein
MAVLDFRFIRRFGHSMLVAGLAVLAVTAAGCGSGNHPPLGRVSGVVTLDGQPLVDADVTFQPEETGRASVGTTDSSGRYELIYFNEVRGALVGKHRVLITTLRDGDDSSPNIPERLPPRYHRESDTQVEVTKGSNTFNFDLESR